MNELISVIVPVYNIASFLPRSIGSILQQSYPRIEVIAVDDGSTDDSLAVLKELAKTDERLKVVHQENGGVTSARLRGVSASSGEWIGFVDGDDWIEPEMFQRLIDNAEKHGADISHCGYQMVFPDRVDYYYNTGRLAVQNKREALKELIAGSFEPGLWNKLFHRRLFQNLLNKSKMDASIRINEDLLMNFYLFSEAERSVFEDFCPYHYMIRSGSAATSKMSLHKLLDPCAVRRIMMENTKEDAELYSLCRQSLVRQLIRLVTLPARNQEDEILSAVRQARDELRSEAEALKNDPYCSKKQKIQAVWAATQPTSYRFVHDLYGEISGTAHKYDIKV